MWIEGTGPGGHIRRSLETSSWERAELLRRELEAPPTGNAPRPAHDPTARDAAEEFYRESVARNLALASLKRHRAFCDLIQGFGDRRCPLMTGFTPESAREFRDAWGAGPSTTSKRLVLLRSFFRFCEENDWRERSPARGLKAPILRHKPTVPFEAEEVAHILQHAGENLTFALVLRHTGLRISDAAKLKASEFDGHHGQIPTPIRAGELANGA